MNNDPDVVLNNDNGIISMALQVYADWAEEMAGNYKGNTPLIDRARELSVLFRDMDSTQRYES
jgi:hypothetical protein